MPFCSCAVNGTLGCGKAQCRRRKQRCVYACTHAHIRVCMPTYIRACVPIHVYVCMHSLVYASMLLCMNACSQINVCKHVRTVTCFSVRKSTHAHTHAHKHTHTHTHTCTYTYTYIDIHFQMAWYYIKAKTSASVSA